MNPSSEARTLSIGTWNQRTSCSAGALKLRLLQKVVWLLMMVLGNHYEPSQSDVRSKRWWFSILRSENAGGSLTLAEPQGLKESLDVVNCPAVLGGEGPAVLCSRFCSHAAIGKMEDLHQPQPPYCMVKHPTVELVQLLAGSRGLTILIWWSNVINHYIDGNHICLDILSNH